MAMINSIAGEEKAEALYKPDTLGELYITGGVGRAGKCHAE